MQIKRTNTSDTNITLTVVASPQELSSLKQHVVSHFRGKVKIAGFREGKAPLDLVEKHVDDAALQSEFLEEAINTMYVQAVQSEGLRPIDNPQVNVIKFVPYTTLEFTATFNTIGELKLADYKKVKLTKSEVKVGAEDVAEVLETLRERSAEKQDVERAAKLGDVVTIDFAGTDSKGEAVAGADGKDYPLTLGSKNFIPGFEEEVVGLKAGEEKTFDITFPKDYHSKPLAGAKVTFAITAKKVQELAKPKLDDAFAATVGPFKALSELKADIKKQLTAERQGEADRQFENDLVLKIADKSTVALPKSMVDEQIQKIEDQERQNLVYRGQTWEEHLKEEGVTAEEHAEQKRPEAERSIKASLVLSEIAEAEGLTVEQEELDLRIQLLKGQYKDEAMHAELDKPENQRDILSRILTEKTLAKLVAYATSNK